MGIKAQEAERGEIPPRIMDDRGGWQFTDELIIRLKKWDTAAIAEFYNANYKILFGMAKKFAWKQEYFCGNHFYEVDDLIQQVYIDLPYYDFSSRCNLYYCIVKGSFLRVNEGGIIASQNKVIKRSLMFSYDAPVNGSEGNTNSSYLLDKFASSPSPYDVLIADEDREKKDDTICAFLEQTIKNRRDLNLMFCQLFTDIPLSQVRGNEYEYYKQCKKQAA
jgi:hypothetical protein